MCRYDKAGTHSGVSANALWVDLHDGDTVYLCAHPDNDVRQGPTFTRTFSLAAWQSFVEHVTHGGGFPKAAE